jgi:hypothetical protein
MAQGAAINYKAVNGGKQGDVSNKTNIYKP